MAARFKFELEYTSDGEPIVNDEEMLDYVSYCTDLDIDKIQAVEEAMTAYLVKVGLATEV